jgi:dihydrofolate synthase / folylpolyglutamate synthase
LNFDETLEYLYTLLPMYQRVGPAAFKKDLTNIIALCEHLGNPQNKFKTVHIAGTNGKGSVTHIMAAMAIKSGYKTGYYTSPHLIDFRERIKINGQMISKSEVVRFVASNEEIIKQIQPSFFEITVAMAFEQFAREEVDLAIIETGLGGRLDSTNIIQPLLSVITNIGHDHMDMLGDTLQQLAEEKAGIIKKNVPVVIGEKQDEVSQIFIRKSEELQAPIYFVEENKGDAWITSDLKGFYQQKNIRTALNAIEVLEQYSQLTFSKCIEALEEVVELTGLLGRWQYFSTEPLTILDTAHNEEGIKEVRRNLEAEEYDSLHIIFGMVKGKNYTDVLQMFPADGIYYLVAPEVPRGLDVDVLKQACDELGYKSEVYKSIGEAYKTAQQNAKRGDCIFVGGSTFTVADFLRNQAD